jgi:hypothetical protein
MFIGQIQKMKSLVFLFIIISWLLPNNIIAQEPDTNTFKGVAAVVFLDSFVVSAKRQGFNPEEFIEYVIEDESFYHAFRNLRMVSYKAKNNIRFFDKKGRQKASYISTTQQFSDGRCRTMKVLDEDTTGKFYKGKNKEYRYYTANLFDRIFFTHGEVCAEKKAQNSHIEENPSQKGRLAKHIHELKKLIFQPGKKADVPVIGDKTEIFSPKMQPHYNYSLLSKSFNDVDCYVFIASPKHSYSKDKTVIKYMETYFEKTNFQVVARNYWLQYDGTLFSFDVKMKVKLTKIGNTYLPASVEYDGTWDVPMKSAEKAKFSATFSTFKIPK